MVAWQEAISWPSKSYSASQEYSLCCVWQTCETRLRADLQLGMGVRGQERPDDVQTHAEAQVFALTLRLVPVPTC